ncbi:MAG: hypothetical protein WC792_01980 [Candidatus Micrarchaeia archaeon]
MAGGRKFSSRDAHAIIAGKLMGEFGFSKAQADKSMGILSHFGKGRPVAIHKTGENETILGAIRRESREIERKSAGSRNRNVHLRNYIEGTAGKWTLEAIKQQYELFYGRESGRRKNIAVYSPAAAQPLIENKVAERHGDGLKLTEKARKRLLPLLQEFYVEAYDRKH